METADLAFLFGRIIQAAVFLPLALLFMAAVLAAMMRALGLGAPGRRGIRETFDRIEEDPRALAIFLCGVVIASGAIVAALVR